MDVVVNIDLLLRQIIVRLNGYPIALELILRRVSKLWERVADEILSRCESSRVSLTDWLV